ncbi:hypothetical protein OCF63_12160 [Bacillus wiedmannii]|uniref:hypothetical protein n=1 Tax=Bacillus wiedmannii TaxID=1890302 RepID=UPI0021D31D35|nr:hypothetical protein [Bacillus wiedmannii]MCU5498750.1 hypothetical protein [Bacillus wiedmannii]
MKTIYRQNTCVFNVPENNRRVIPKRSGKITDLIKTTDDLLEKGYDFLEPIYKVVEHYELKQATTARSTKPQQYRGERLLYKEKIYYEALMVESPNLFN